MSSSRKIFRNVRANSNAISFKTFGSIRVQPMHIKGCSGNISIQSRMTILKIFDLELKYNSIRILIGIFFGLFISKSISAGTCADLAFLLDDYLEDNGLCKHAFNGPLIQYKPSVELFMYTVYHIYFNLFKVHNIMDFSLLNPVQQLYGHYICITDMQMVTVLSIYERCLELQLLEKIPLDQSVISKSTLTLLNELDIFLKLRMDIFFAQTNIIYKFNLNLNPEELLFQKYILQWDRVVDAFKNFFNENIL